MIYPNGDPNDPDRDPRPSRRERRSQTLPAPLRPGTLSDGTAPTIGDLPNPDLPPPPLTPHIHNELAPPQTVA